MPADGVVAHGDVQRVDDAIGVNDGAVFAQELVVTRRVAAQDQPRIGVSRVVQPPQHRKALQRGSVAQLRLERHPLTSAEELPEGLLDGLLERGRVSALHGYRAVQAPREAALVGRRVALEGHGHRGMGEEGDVDRPGAGGPDRWRECRPR